MVWREGAVLCAAVAAAWVARLLGWLGGVPVEALAAMTGYALLVWLARFCMARKGINIVQDLRPDAWEKVGQGLVVACLSVTFTGLLFAVALRLSGRPGLLVTWSAWLAMVAAFAAAGVMLMLIIYGVWRRWRRPVG